MSQMILFGLEISVGLILIFPFNFPTVSVYFSMKTDFSQTNLDFWICCLSSYFRIFFF